LAEQGKDLNDLLDEVWARHGFHGTEQISIRVTDMGAITTLLARLRTTPPREIAGRSVESIDDLAAPSNGLPPTDGLRMWLSGGIRIIIRPSGTEAKLKCYIEVISPDQQSAEKELNSLRAPLKAFLGA
jgi:phosphomannomutase